MMLSAMPAGAAQRTCVRAYLGNAYAAPLCARPTLDRFAASVIGSDYNGQSGPEFACSTSVGWRDT